jgi:hypothetical protein
MTDNVEQFSKTVSEIGDLRRGAGTDMDSAKRNLQNIFNFIADKHDIVGDDQHVTLVHNRPIHSELDEQANDAIIHLRSAIDKLEVIRKVSKNI